MSNLYKIPSRYNWIFENGDKGDLLIDNKNALIRKYFTEGLKRVLCIFDYKKIPKTISPRTIELFILGGYGKIFVKDGKWYCGTGTTSGVLTYDYIPISSLVVNTFLRYSETLENVTPLNIDDITKENIEKYCFLIPNDDLYSSLYDEIREYAELMTECVLTIKFLLYNARIPTINVSNSDTIEESFKKMYDDIINGKTNISLKGNYMFDSIKTYPTSSVNTNQIKDVIECMQYICAKFEQRIGLNANYNMKRESLNDDEISLNDDGLLPTIDEMFESRLKAYDNINYVSQKLYGEKVFEIDLKSAWKIKRDEIEIEMDLQKSEIKENLDTSEPKEESKDGDNNENDIKQDV